MLLDEIKQERPPLDAFIIEKIIDRFSTKQSSISAGKEAFFSQFWQGYAWAAILGFIHDRRSELGNVESKFTMGTVAQNNEIFQTLILLAIANSDSGFDIVNNPKAILKIISEYAKGGAEYVEEIRATPGKETYFNNPSDFLEEIIDRNNE